MEIEKPSLKELLAQRQTLQQQVRAARQREAEVVRLTSTTGMETFNPARDPQPPSQVLTDILNKFRQIDRDINTIRTTNAILHIKN
jgi:hypothetical protein